MTQKLLGFGVAIIGFTLVCFFLGRFQIFVLDAPKETTTPLKVLMPIFQTLSPAVTLLSIIGAFLLFASKISGAPKETKLVSKLVRIEQGFILFWAALGFAMAFNFLAYILTARIYFMMFGYGAVIFIALFRPTVDTCIRYLQLSEEEVNAFENGKVLEYDKQKRAEI